MNKVTWRGYLVEQETEHGMQLFVREKSMGKRVKIAFASKEQEQHYLRFLIAARYLGSVLCGLFYSYGGTSIQLSGTVLDADGTTITLSSDGLSYCVV